MIVTCICVAVHVLPAFTGVGTRGEGGGGAIAPPVIAKSS